jgi:hypothetical protein
MCYREDFTSRMFDRSRDLWDLFFGPNPDSEDVVRWTSQKFDSIQNGFIMRQTEGGPCGVLAPVQAFLIHKLVFQDGLGNIDELKNVSLERFQSTLLCVLETVLKRALPSPEFPVVWLQFSSQQNQFFSVDFVNMNEFTALDFLASVAASRTIDMVWSDMDDPSNTLIERFGHCSQETLNLMLFGRATSNAFDRDQPMGDTGLVLRGVPEEADIQIGLLSELESLRYVTIGLKLKNPSFPIWIIGSQSHYTVLFSFDKSDCHVAPNERIRQFIASKFAQLQLDEGIMDSENLNQLASLMHLAPPQFEDRTRLNQSGVVILDDVLSWARPQLQKKPEFADEQVRDLTRDYQQLYFVNNQISDHVYSVRIYREGGTSCPDPVLPAILATRWPTQGIVFS